jgi:hypothetical protein
MPFAVRIAPLNKPLTNCKTPACGSFDIVKFIQQDYIGTHRFDDAGNVTDLLVGSRSQFFDQNLFGIAFVPRGT